jgi:hypothetical protein
METIDRELLLKEYRIAWLIWIAMVFSLCMYLLICRYMDDAVRQSMENIEVLRTALFAVSFVVLGTAFFLRRRMLKVTPASMETDISSSGNDPSLRAPGAGKYVSNVVISLALCESVGIYGLVLFFVGDSTEILYTFIAISAAAMLYFRPKKEEMEAMIMAVERKNASTWSSI